MNEKNLLKLMFELGILIKTPRTGFYHIGLTNHESPASHSFRMTALAYFISQEEKADTNKILKMCLVHDWPETRILDQTFIQKRFYNVKDKEKDALFVQLRGLNGSKELQELFNEFIEGKSKESKIVKDADILETLIEAKEYVEQGVKLAENWFEDKQDGLHTKTAKNIFNILKKQEILWWKE